ncbi:unnamed protein product [Hydatigera taeniaeformis]|uniref:Uncharacterized protein n=1 Tax=Hydatigena taeniaeformis TaxID=6205 RepID=A0A0R3WWX8_HYDTA|nr:unnamed protein product [Hydatigera taeniaeformis]
MCNSLTRTEVLEIAFKLIRNTAASNAALLWSSMNSNINHIPQAMSMNDLMKPKPSVRCGCWKCRGRTVNEVEAEKAINEVVTYLDSVLEEFVFYFHQNRKFGRNESTPRSERKYDSSLPLRLSIDDDDGDGNECAPSSVVCSSIDSPPCVDDELVSDYAVQEKIIDQGSPTRRIHKLHIDTEITYRQNFLPNSLVASTL